ncbi:MAG TPA: SRPBCC family protein [Candidatus Limnocylindrales bacterium]|nr:SRPBCC family protein [Candidatus Limnocylindrales bacterium]
MIKYSSEVTIDRPPREVFGALLNPARYAEWTEMVDMAFDGGGSPEVGTKGSFRLSAGPIKGRLGVELTELVPDRKLVFEISHPTLDWTAVSTIEPAGSGTRLTYAGTIRFRGWRRVLEPIAGGEISRGEGNEVLRLKTLLEGSAG